MSRMMAWGLALGLCAAGVMTVAAEEMVGAKGEVARAVVTGGISGREPVDEMKQVTGDDIRVHFFTELRDMQGQRVVHRWVYNDEVMAEVGFDVSGARWRVWSTKTLLPAWKGTWRVSVVDGSGTALVSREFTYEAQ